MTSHAKCVIADCVELAHGEPTKMTLRNPQHPTLKDEDIPVTLPLCYDHKVTIVGPVTRGLTVEPKPYAPLTCARCQRKMVGHNALDEHNPPCLACGRDHAGCKHQAWEIAMIDAYADSDD